jgi:transcriptional regulator with XRE-family HTH domain
MKEGLMARDAKKDWFVARLERAINASEKSQLQIADELGYPNANLITIFKKGTTRVPLEKVPAMARALDLEPADFLRDWLAVYMPGALVAIEELVGTPLSRSERTWVDGLRKTFSTVPPFDKAWSEGLKDLVRSSAPATIAA